MFYRVGIRFLIQATLSDTFHENNENKHLAQESAHLKSL